MPTEKTNAYIPSAGRKKRVNSYIYTYMIHVIMHIVKFPNTRITDE